MTEISHYGGLCQLGWVQLQKHNKLNISQTVNISQTRSQSGKFEGGLTVFSGQFGKSVVESLILGMRDHP